MADSTLVVVFRRRLPVPPDRVAAENTRGESIVGAVMETVQKTIPTARVVSISRDTTVADSLTLFFVGTESTRHADLRRAIRTAPMNWRGARTCVFATAAELHERLKMEFQLIRPDNETDAQAHARAVAHVDFLRQLGLPEWFLELYEDATDDGEPPN